MMTRALILIFLFIIGAPAHADAAFDQCVATDTPVIAGFDPILCYPPYSQQAAQILKIRRLAWEQKMQATSHYPVDFTLQNEQTLVWAMGVSCAQLSPQIQAECRSFWTTIYN
jgi:hypothetical protein